MTVTRCTDGVRGRCESVMPDVWTGGPTAADETDPNDDPDFEPEPSFNWPRAVTELVGNLI